MLQNSSNNALTLSDDEYYGDAKHYAGVIAPSKQAVDFIDPAPKPFVVQIPLVEYFERVKRLKADRWQVDFMNRLQRSVEERHLPANERTVKLWVEYHAEAQLGKTIILSQTFKAWCFGNEPLWRAILAMYNVSRSTAHSQVVIDILRSPIHRDIFPHKDGHLPSSVSKDGWSTNARLDVESGNRDGQLSFNPVGLVSGMTGSGFDWLTIDDPYKEPKDAFSVNMWENLDRFWTYGVIPRVSPNACIAAMFHRYNYDDFGGHLLNTAKFDYVRYATVADGPYIHAETGQKFEDPLGRSVGEYISPERRPPSYYTDKFDDDKVRLSMFQGRPGKDEGDFFKVGMIGVASEDDWGLCTLKARGWDHAATQGAGDNSAGGWLGLAPNGTVIVADVFSGQLDTAKRIEKQRSLAEADGVDTTVVVPEGVSSDGKDNVFLMQQNLQGFNVVGRKVTNAAAGSDAKKRRANGFSVAVNSGRVRFLPGAWVEKVKMKMRRFGNSVSGDDEIDAMADAHNFLYEEFHKGLVIKTPPIERPWKEFTFGQQIPAHWTVYAAVKISADSTLPNSSVIVTRAAQNSGLTDTLFIVDEYKEYTSDYEGLFTWLDASLKKHIALPSDAKESRPDATIWLHPDSEDYAAAIRQKLKYNVRLFEGDGGIVEANWYAQNRKLIGLGELLNVKQEAATWGFDGKGEPTKIGQVWDCLRMVCYEFRTFAKRLTKDEKREFALPVSFQLENIEKEKADLSEQEYGQKLLTRQAKLVTPKILKGAHKPKDRFAKFRR